MEPSIRTGSQIGGAAAVRELNAGNWQRWPVVETSCSPHGQQMYCLAGQIAHAVLYDCFVNAIIGRFRGVHLGPKDIGDWLDTSYRLAVQ